MSSRRIRPSGSVRGPLTVPGSKSVTNRYLTMALLARCRVQLDGPLLSDDPLAYIRALRELGHVVSGTDRRLTIDCGSPAQEAEVYCGASGSMLRFVVAALSTRPGRWLVDGTARLRERPVGDLLQPLRQLGAGIECLGEEGFAPLRITGGRLGGGEVDVESSDSSQFVSGLIMAATQASAPVVIRARGLVSAPYVEITRRVVAQWGASVSSPEVGVLVVEPAPLEGGRYSVEGDFSSACYPAAATALVGGEIELPGLDADSAQGDRGFFEVLSDMGGSVSWRGDRARVRASGNLAAVDRDMSGMPDQVPTLAVLAPFARGVTRIRGVPHLRLKESDRLKSVAGGLRAVGARVEEHDDGLTIPGVWATAEPPSAVALVDSADDHRIAMSFAVLGLKRGGVEIACPSVVEKSYPRFWSDFSRCFEAG